MSNLTKKQAAFVDAATKHFPGVTVLNRKQVLEVCEKYGLKEPQWFLKPAYLHSRGYYQLPVVGPVSAVVVQTQPEDKAVAETMQMSVVPLAAKKTALSISESVYEGMVPARDRTFVKFGIYKDLKEIIASRLFYPVFISGLSGNGKSFTPEQICAELKREFFRVNITKQTNEDDLLGGFRLVNGETVWYDGPVVQAAERGAILVLDEIDYGSAEITCMQNVLEGKPFLIKKVNKVVVPKPGFNIIATANTKGQGDIHGKFVFTNVLNEAFLERFAVTLDQEYPPASVEEKILGNVFTSLGLDPTFVGNYGEMLVKWANTNRETFKSGAMNEVISTRRLVHIAKAFNVFKDRKKAVEICLNRFDNETRTALYDLYCKIDAPVVVNDVNENGVADALGSVADVDGGVAF